MIYERLYNKYIEIVSKGVCGYAPEKAFAEATWEQIALHADVAFAANQKAGCPLPKYVSLGYDVAEEASLRKIVTKDGKAIPVGVPVVFPWSSYRGLHIRINDLEEGDESDAMSFGCSISVCMLMRIFLQSGNEKVLIHKVDPRNMGHDMSFIPKQVNAPVVVTRNGLLRLLERFREQIANNPVDGLAWRVDTMDASFSSDTSPVQIVLIADWGELRSSDSDSDKLSEVQDLILRMLETDLAAKNGIYFIICSDDSSGELFRDKMPELRIDYRAKTDYVAQLSAEVSPGKDTEYAIQGDKKFIELGFPFDEEQMIQIQQAYKRFTSGTMFDEDGTGYWKGDSSKGLRAIMGITPQGENQFFELGVGQAFDAFHALVGGATGSGKSVLLSEIICSLAERYSPKELRMLLLDYKEGTEFAPFAGLPHVYALSMGSNAEFGLEVLKETQKEIVRRGRLFKEAGAKNLAEYRQKSGETLCRYILVADEFQVLLGDKKYGEEAKAVLNDLVRRGRSFGFHAILATQTLRDGCLDGEAKNQFGCRIAMRMAESETDYFLGAGNTVPATFNRKGQALLNYALGHKGSNIIFQSGNKAMPKNFRDTPEVLECVNTLRAKAEEEQSLPSDVYIYSSDGFAEMPTDVDNNAGVLVGLRNNMRSTPIYLNRRQLGGKILIVGGTEQKRRALLDVLQLQLGVVYGESVRIQSPEDYLDNNNDAKCTILNAAEGDFDLEDAVITWKDSGSQTPAAPKLVRAAEEDIASEYVAPEGMEDDFAELMKSMQINSTAMIGMDSAPSGRERRANRDTRCLIIALSSVADIKLIESAGFYTQDFRTVLYLDNNAYNQVSGNFESGQLGESAAILESPRGVVSKIRLIRL